MLTLAQQADNRIRLAQSMIRDIVPACGYNVQHACAAMVGIMSPTIAGGMLALPDFTAAAAMSRGADVAARQIEAKIIQPALPMLETAKARIQAEADAKGNLAAAIERYRAAFGSAVRVDNDGDFSVSRKDGGYVRGTIGSDGSVHFTTISRIKESAAAAILSAIVGA